LKLLIPGLWQGTIQITEIMKTSRPSMTPM
jgi:hypothetical protein